MSDTERIDSTGRPRKLQLAWLRVDQLVNIKISDTDSASNDRVVRIMPKHLAIDLNALGIPGLRVEYRPPVEVPTKVGAVVIDGDNAFIRVEGPHVSPNQRPWRRAGRNDWLWDREIFEYLNRGQGIRATIASEGVEL